MALNNLGRVEAQRVVLEAAQALGHNLGFLDTVKLNTLVGKMYEYGLTLEFFPAEATHDTQPSKRVIGAIIKKAGVALTIELETQVGDIVDRLWMMNRIAIV